MSEKITLTRYLKGRGEVKALTHIEALSFGVPYPLQPGWPVKYGAMEITASMIEDLKTRIATARPSTASKAQRGLDGLGGTLPVAQSHGAVEGSVARSVAILNKDGLPIEIVSLINATALDLLAFMASLVKQANLEALARREGKTFAHGLGGSIGAQRLSEISERSEDYN